MKRVDYKAGYRTTFKGWKMEKAAHQTTLNALCERQSELDKERKNVFLLLEESGRLRENNKALLRRLDRQECGRVRPGVDLQAELVMNMKKAMEYSINTSAALLDAMGELVDHVSGRKAKLERDQERNPLLVGNDVPDPSR